MVEQLAIPVPPDQPAGSKQPCRVRTRVTHADNKHLKMQVYLNGDLITGEHRLTIRLADLTYLVNLLQPEIIIVDRENITDVAWLRLKNFDQVELI